MSASSIAFAGLVFCAIAPLHNPSCCRRHDYSEARNGVMRHIGRRFTRRMLLLAHEGAMN